MKEKDMFDPNDEVEENQNDVQDSVPIQLEGDPYEGYETTPQSNGGEYQRE